MKNLLKKSISLLAAAMICTAQIPVGATHIMVQDAITKAFTLYQNGNYYEAIQVLENTNKNFATDSQLAEINDIIKYANDAKITINPKSNSKEKIENQLPTVNPLIQIQLINASIIKEQNCLLYLKKTINFFLILFI